MSSVDDSWDELAAYYERTYGPYMGMSGNSVADRIRTTKAAVPKEWQPIGTAPHDGSDLLLGYWVMHDVPGGPFLQAIVGGWDVEECGGEGGWRDSMYLEEIHPQPEFWMPIPGAYKQALSGRNARL